MGVSAQLLFARPLSAGKAGTVSESLVNKVRSKLGLTGKKRTEGETSEANSETESTSSKGKKGRGASEASGTRSLQDGREGGTGLSKSAFVVEMLGREPKANVKAINEAWTAAGNEGSISDSVVYKLKRELGATGRRSSGRASKPKSSRRMASPVEETPSQAKAEHASPKPTATMASRGNGHGRVLDEIEGEIDELMFRLKGLGGFDEVQEALRAARRLLIRSHGE